MSADDRRVDALLRRRKFERFHRGPDVSRHGEPQTWSNPLDELCEREEAAMREAVADSVEIAQEMLGLEILPEQLVAAIAAKVFEGFQQYEQTLIAWLFDDSPHPLPVLRRLFIYARKKNSRLIWNMSYRDLGELFALSHETMRVEAKKLFGELPGGATKGAEARAKMKAAAMRNCNRRGGHKARRSLAGAGAS